MVYGSVEVSGGNEKGASLTFKRGWSFHPISIDVLPYCWENHFDEGVTAPRFCDVHVKPLDLREFLWLTTQLGKTVFRIRYIFF